MRNLLAALTVLGLLATPSLGIINVKLTVDGPNVGGKVQLVNDASTTVRIWAQGTGSGLYALAGDVIATPPGLVLITNLNSIVFSPQYSPTGLFSPKPGIAGSNGGWTSFGTQQTTWDTPNPNLGKADYVEVAHYLVTALPAPAAGVVTLTFAGKSVSGYKPLETDKTGVMGTVTSAMIEVVPEPVTMALLALGGLVVARRRR